MKSRLTLKSLALLFNLILSVCPVVPQAATVPVTGEVAQSGFQIYLPLVISGATGAVMPSAPQVPSSEAFVASVVNGEAGVVRGVYVPGVLALPVRQQPANNPAYVSPEDGVATQFASAAALGVTGLLAHNYLAGADFFKLAEEQEVRIVYGDGAVKPYRVTMIYRFQALDPYSPYSDFVDLSTGETLSVGQVFTMVYAGGDHVTFQTCIANNGNASWGRLFVIATPVE
jgi:hypothetical protein